MAKQQSKKAEPKKAATGTQVATKPAVNDSESLVLVQDQVPEYLQGQQEARGSEHVGTEDLVIPRLEVVQAQSPAITEGDPGFVKGAKLGDLINSVTNQIYGREVFVVPVHYSKQWLVWRDRQKGGGFRGAYPNPEEAKDRVEQEGGKAAGFEAVDTPTHLCLIVNRETGGVDEIIVSMPKTKAKVSRQWNSMIKMAGGDRFSRVYRIMSQSETNAKGTFQNYVIGQSGFPSKALYQRAEKLYLAVKGGERNVVMDVKGFDAGGDTDEEGDM